MSEHVGGHELDAPNSRALFNIIWGLSAVTFLAIVTCVQLFNQQRDALVEEQKSSFRLQEYRQEMAEKTQKAGETELKTPDGKTREILKYIPLAQAKNQVLRNPQMALKAELPPQGWIHPDDIASGTQSVGNSTASGKGPLNSVVPPVVVTPSEPQGQQPATTKETASPKEEEQQNVQEKVEPPKQELNKEVSETATESSQQPKAVPKKPVKKPAKEPPAAEKPKVEESSEPPAPPVEKPEESTPQKPAVESEQPIKNEPIEEQPQVKEDSEL